MAAPKIKRKKTLKGIFKRNSARTATSDDEALDASLMRYDKQKSLQNIQLDNPQTQMLQKIYNYHNVDITRLKNTFKKGHQIDAFVRKNQTVIDNARTANIVILGTSGSGKTKIWWNFLNYYSKSYLDRNSWGLSPKDFYNIITEKIMNISVDILIEYNYHRQQMDSTENKYDDIEEIDVLSTCLSKNGLIEPKQYKLELDQDDDIKEGYLFFQDLISKLEKIRIAINNNVDIEEKKKFDGLKPNWDKIQELRNIEKTIKEFAPSIAPIIQKLWKSKQLRDMYLYEYGLNNARNLFYFIDNIYKFECPTDNKWAWKWSFDEILRCQIRTTGVIEQSTNLYIDHGNDAEEDNNDIEQKNFNLRLRIWDFGGAQNERKKWRHVLNLNPDAAQIDCVIFVVNLMSYYKKSYEANTNDLRQSLQLFTCLLSSNNHNNDYDHDCVDTQVKNAVNNISLFYVIFTDVDGLRQMLENNISFKTCFEDYDGDNSVYDVQAFIQNKFESVMDIGNDEDSSQSNKTQLTRATSLQKVEDDNKCNRDLLKRMKSDSSLLYKEKASVGGGKTKKTLICRFVSVIDHNAMKSVMNEIVESSMLNKTALNGVISSLFGY